jgi:hypothetical protein
MQHRPRLLLSADIPCRRYQVCFGTLPLRGVISMIIKLLTPKAGAEVDKAEAYLKNAMSHVNEADKIGLSAIDADIKVLKSELNEKDENVKKRYRDIEDKLYDLIYKKQI